MGDDEDDDDTLPALTTPEIVQLYEEVLSELTFNSKPIITELTMIAGDHREHAQGIADAICARILKVPVDQKLSSLYLLDSIVKNIGREYVRHFGARLVKVFCEAYDAVDSNLHPAMRHLFGTWSQVFPPSVLCRIEDELQFTTPSNQRSIGLADMRHSESPSPRPSHGIHVNPKYLEARRQLENHAAMRVIDSHNDDTMDLEGEGELVERNASEKFKGWSGASKKFHDVGQPREVSSSLQVLGQKPSVQYGQYDLDHTELHPTRIGISGVGSPQTARASSMGGVEGPFSDLKHKVSRPSSPPRFRTKRSISPLDDRFHRDISPGRAERVSPSHSVCGHGRASDQDGWLDRRWPSVDVQQLESSISYNQNNGYAKQRSRELIDAYGNSRETGNTHESPPKVQRLDVNGINSKRAARNWQSSEEEEYIWEDMSPTLADASNRSIHPFGNGRLGLNRSDDRLLEPDFRRSSWRGQALLPSVDVEDRTPAPYFDRGSMNKRHLNGVGSQDESLLQYQNSYHLQERGKFPYGLPRYSSPILSPRSQGRAVQVPYSVSGTIPSFGQKLPGPYYNLPDAEVRRLPSITRNLNLERPAIEKHLAHRPYSPPRPPIIYPPHKSQPLPLLPLPSNQTEFQSQCDFVEGNKPVLNQGPNSSFFLPWQQYDAADRNTTTLSKPLQLPHQLPCSVHLWQQNQDLSSARVQPQEGSYPQLSSHLPQPLNHVRTQRQDVVMGSHFPNPLSGVPSAGLPRMSDPTSQVHGTVLPPLPPGPPPVSSQTGPASQNTSSSLSNSPASSFSGLIGTLVAQGLIKLTPPGQSQDSVGVEFNVELLKVRHEPVVDALYSDLPRQCTTCGLRFKCQEEHSSHMDWHVAKNRISKNRKQKPSRKWFVSAKEWLSGAEILGTDAVPGFLPTEVVADKKENKEMAVPADEDQNVCALCGEMFEDFYSDETEEWMYKGAVYLNAPNGITEGLQRSLLGPIVHAKCRSESAEDIGHS